MEEYTQCEIWGTPAKDNYKGDGREIISARTGGSYFVPGTGEALLEHHDDSVKVRLTDWLVEQRMARDPMPSNHCKYGHGRTGTVGRPWRCSPC